MVKPAVAVRVSLSLAETGGAPVESLAVAVFTNGLVERFDANATGSE